MILNNKIKTLLCILPITILVGIYQLPVIENTAIKYNINIEINEKIPYSREAQQLLENNKISLVSYLDSPIYKPELNTTSLVNNKSILSNNTAHLNTDDSNNSIDLNTEKTIPNTESPKPTLTKCLENCKVLMLGDSVMGDVSFALQRLLKKQQPTWEVITAHKVGSGLSNQNYYNWPATAKKLVEQYKPDYVYILLGTNDAQSFSSNGKGYAFGKEGWINEYGNRVTQITDVLNNNPGHWGWIQLPLVRDRGFNSKLQVIRSIHEQRSKENFINTESVFGKLDHSEPIDMKLRANDGIHLNAAGATKMAKIIAEKFNLS